MVDIIEVINWNNITRGQNFNGYSAFWVRLKQEDKIFEIAKELNIPYIFKKGRELVCSDGIFLYWYK